MNIHELNTKAITNPAYVALDDGSDTYKLDLNAKLSTMQSSISGAESDIATAQADITLLQTNMGQAQGAISSAQGEIEDLQSDLNALSTQTAASIGNLQTEVDAVEDDVTDLKGDLKETVDFTEVSYTTTGQVVLNGGTSANPNYKISSPAFLKAGTKIILNGYSDKNVWLVSLSNANGDYIAPLYKVAATGDINATVTIDSDSYVIFCGYFGQWHTNSDFYYYVSSTVLSDKIIANAEVLSDIQSVCNLYDIATIQNDTYISPSGVESYAEGWDLRIFPVTGGETYFFTQPCASIQGICFFDITGTFVGNVYTLGAQAWNSEVTIPSTAVLCKAQKQAGYNNAFFGYKANYTLMQVGYNRRINSNVYVKADDETIYIGAGEQFTSVRLGLAYAWEHNLNAVIRPGTYNLYSDGVTSGTGLKLPKKLSGYGAKLVLSLPSENWNTSALNFVSDYPECVVEGLEIEVTNCRYCIHDEMYNNVNYYHHVLKDLVLKHNSETSETLIRPICIGGGFGNSGRVDIINCRASSKDTRHTDIDYHANSSGQTGNCEVYVTGCVLEQGVSISQNALTGFKNTMYVSNCLCGNAPVDPDTANTKLISWNNDII